MVNVNLLRAETVKRGFKDKDVAKNALKISPQAYAKKLKRLTKFTTADAEAICNYLNITDKCLRTDIFLA